MPSSSGCRYGPVVGVWPGTGYVVAVEVVVEVPAGVADGVPVTERVEAVVGAGASAGGVGIELLTGDLGVPGGRTNTGSLLDVVRRLTMGLVVSVAVGAGDGVRVAVPVGDTLDVAEGVLVAVPVLACDGDGDGLPVAAGAAVGVSVAVGESVGVGVASATEFVFDCGEGSVAGDGLDVGEGAGDGAVTDGLGISILMTAPGTTCEPLNAPAAPALARARTPMLSMPRVKMPRPSDEPRKRRTRRPSELPAVWSSSSKAGGSV